MSSRYALTMLLLSACATERPEEKPVAPTPAPAAAAAPTPAQTPDADFRTRKPAALPLKLSYAPPVPEERDLPNGLRILVAENHSLPLVAVDLLFLAGTDVEPRGQAGLADFYSSLLLEGTPKLDAAAFAEARDELAAEMRATSILDGTRLHLNCTRDVLAQALQLFAEAAIHP
ncbi:MAG TPA: insulinase family protein, partial [Myxococcaceae bacterium]|nr:insulinase family protein [Myxococcaceae bacterium]